jgi:D-3-phosphoglycerate dehydrogenase / 2-oxoglutarate reductase
VKCLLIQPIHPSGVKLLEDAGVEAVQASSLNMDIVAREIAGMDAAITRNAGLSRVAMSSAAALRILGNHGIGTDPVDVAYATEIGLPVAFTPYANVQSVAELVIGHMLAIAKRVREADTAVRSGHFDYRYTRDFRELSGKVLLICGFGRIGRRTAEIARNAFGMKILVHSPSVPAADIQAAGFVAASDLDAGLAEADYVSLHQVLNDRTRGLFSRERLMRMKPGASLINTARGAIVFTQGLIDAVSSGHLRGAAFDVFDMEPLPADHPFTKCPGILLAPHIGGSTEEAAERTAVQVATAVIDALNGRRPEFLVNPEVWDRRRAA